MVRMVQLVQCEQLDASNSGSKYTHLLNLTLRRANQILKVIEKETAHKGLSHININYSYEQELLYFRSISVLIIKILQIIK